VYGFATAIQHGRAALDHMADMFVPLYMWRAAAFMSDTAPDRRSPCRHDSIACATRFSG
jgi:hypothetical protein